MFYEVLLNWGKFNYQATIGNSYNKNNVPLTYLRN